MDWKEAKKSAVARWFSGSKAVVCHYCGLPLTPLSVTVDHMDARCQSKDPHARSNLVPSCMPCNNEKGNAEYEAFKAWKLPVKQARCAGLAIPNVGPFQATANLRMGGVEMYPSRLRILKIMASPGAYALPNGAIPFRFLDGRMGTLSGDVATSLERRGWLERAVPPSKEKGRLFVWRITGKGREALSGVLDQN